jgi:hypothetical protein
MYSYITRGQYALAQFIGQTIILVISHLAQREAASIYADLSAPYQLLSKLSYLH